MCQDKDFNESPCLRGISDHDLHILPKCVNGNRNWPPIRTAKIYLLTLTIRALRQ